MSSRLTASLVIYESEPALFEPAIYSFLNSSSDAVLVVVDNSATPTTSEIFNHARVKYVFNNANVGFGKAHNIAFSLVKLESDFHLILNPDVEFNTDVLSNLLLVIANDSNVSAVMPKVVYPDGALQRLCKLLPSPIDLIFRRFIPCKSIVNKLNARYELHSLPQDKITNIPTLSGCFLLVRSSSLLQIGGFDERYFMYMEDVDLVRRLGDLGETLYVPKVQVVHQYAKGSYSNPKLLKYHLKSAIQYFGKWGWFIDSVRSRRNRAVLNKIEK